MKKKKVLTSLFVVLLLMVGLFFTARHSRLQSIIETAWQTLGRLVNSEQATLPLREVKVSSTQPIEEWTEFVNKRFNYIFIHPISLDIDAEDGKGADFSSDLDSIVTISSNGSGIFNVTRLYLDEESIQSGVRTNIEAFVPYEWSFKGGTSKGVYRPY